MTQSPVNWIDRLTSRQYDYTKPSPPDKIYFTIDGNVIGTAGNFVAIGGAQKAGKTTFISAIITAFITWKPFWGIKLESFENKYKIALFDTEQSPYDFGRLVGRIKAFTGWEEKGIFTNFDAFLCREDSAGDIIRLINAYLKSHPETGIVIIDGLLDLIDNMNDEAASKKLIRLLKKWGKIHDVLIIYVLHTGKKEGNTLGHIGSASDRYAQSTLNVEKTKDGTFLMTGKYLRSAASFEGIHIKYSESDKKYIKLDF